MPSGTGVAAVLLGAACAVGLALETVLRLRNPHRLPGTGSDPAAPHVGHPGRGWTPRTAFAFPFAHKYLRGTRRVGLNNLGLHERADVPSAKMEGELRVAVFGDTTSAGYELPAEDTIAARLQSLLGETFPGRPVRVLNAAARDYNTAQLFDWWEEVFAPLGIDVVVYLFNLNHPRRNITVHEAGKPLAQFQPSVATLSGGRLAWVEAPAPRHVNDLSYLEADGRIRVVSGRDDASLWGWLTARSHVANAIDDLRLGRDALRRHGDRTEIKDLERRASDDAFPYYWRITAALVEEWSRRARERGSAFVIVSNLNYYNAGEGRLLDDRSPPHPLGFLFDRIPERRFLPAIAAEAGATYVDTYAYARERGVAGLDFYLHPRYAYFDRAGAAFMAEAIRETVWRRPDRPVPTEVAGRTGKGGDG